jgi:hypothetical protein
MYGRAKRIGVVIGLVASIVAILAGLPSALETIVFFARIYWFDPPPLQHPAAQKPAKGRIGPGPGRCPEFHVFRTGQCRDVRQ